MEPGDGAYPRRAQVLGAAAPVLHVAGIIDDSSASVAIVGSRAASAADMSLARHLGRHVGAGGGVVVSGGALGVDTAAHLGALDAGAATAVVLGTGVDVVYPERNRHLFAAVVERGGALVSMFPPGAPPRAEHFVRRNRLIAALADLVVVVAAAGSSGALHTARDALRLGRRLAAVPGTAGTDALIAAGAAMVEEAGDLDRALAGDPRRPVRPPLDGDHARAWAALDLAVPRDAGDVAVALGLPYARVVALLCDLEATGWTIAVPGGAQVRAP